MKESIRRGNKKNVVILTRDVSYRKGRNSTMPLVKLRYKKYPKFIETMENRHIVYNETLAIIEKEEAAGNLFVIRPQAPVEVARLEKDKGKLLELYQQGLEDGRAAIDDMKAYLEEDNK